MTSLHGTAALLIALAVGTGVVAANEVAPSDRPSQHRPTSITFPDSDGKRYFNSLILPALARNGCMNCHAPAPGHVYPAMLYEHLLQFLAMGQSPTDNILMLKLANTRSFSADQPAHVGGQRCSSEDAEPCTLIQSWWQIEFGVERP